MQYNTKNKLFLNLSQHINDLELIKLSGNDKF